MEELFDRICAAHDVRTVSVTYFQTYRSFTVYLHWSRPEEQLCASGTGNTIDEALAAAVAEMRERRVGVAA
jgi:hypothetical protein